MTNKRYFYSDDLAAAWMAKHFGMRFQATYPNHFKNRDYDTLEDVLNYGGGVHLSIHPDSLHLLEPLWSGWEGEGEDSTCDGNGDLLEYTHAQGRVVGFVCHSRDMQHFDYYSVDGEWVGDGNRPVITEILKRNGVAFMWPESEAA